MELQRIQPVACKLWQQFDALEKRRQVGKGPPRRWIIIMLARTLLPELLLRAPRLYSLTIGVGHTVLARLCRRCAVRVGASG